MTIDAALRRITDAMDKHKFSFLMAIGLLIFSFSDSPHNTKAVLAQDFDNPAASESKLQQLRNQQQILEAEQAVLEQQRALIKLKGTAVAPLTNATRSLDSSTTQTEQEEFQTVESRILAYEAMNKVAGAIYEDINDIDNVKALVIYDPEIFSAITAYRLLKVKIKEFQERYAELQIQADPPRFTRQGGSRGITDFTPLGLPTTFTRSVLEFVALFRSRDKIIFEQDFKLNPNSLVSAIASRFQKNNDSIKIYNPGFYTLSFSEADDVSLEGIVGPEFSTLLSLRSKASNAYGGPPLQDLNDEVDTFLESLLFSEGKADPYGNSPLLSIIQANQLEKILNQDGSYVLHLNIDVAGGSHRTRSSLFTTIFSGNRITFSGGSVVNYSLFARDGSLQKSDFYYYNTGYTGMNGLKTNIKK